MYTDYSSLNETIEKSKLKSPSKLTSLTKQESEEHLPLNPTLL